MNKVSKIIISRIIMSVIILVILLFPFHEVGIDFPIYLIKESIVVDLKYIIVGVLFIVASIIDYFDRCVSPKNNIMSDFEKFINGMLSKLLTNSVLIILACEGKISPSIAVIINMRDIVIDALKKIVGNREEALGKISLSKAKYILLIIGIILTLFYNLPFELIPLRVSDFLLAVSAILSIITGVKYYITVKVYLREKK